MSEITALFGTLQMQIIVIMIAVDVVLGITASIVKKDLLVVSVNYFKRYIFLLGIHLLVGRPDKSSFWRWRLCPERIAVDNVHAGMDIL